jgi:hypothetical protein
VGSDGAEQHQFLADKTRRDGDPMVRQRHDKPLGAGGSGGAGRHKNHEDERETAHQSGLT